MLVILCGLFEWRRISAIFLQYFKNANIQWLSYCNDDVYDAIIFLLYWYCVVWAWKRISTGFIIVNLYLFCHWISCYQEGGVCIKLTDVCVGRFYTRIWISNRIWRSLFMINGLWWEVVVRFVGNVEVVDLYFSQRTHSFNFCYHWYQELKYCK